MKKPFFKINFLLLKEAFFCLLFAFAVLGLVSLIGLNLSFFSPFKNAFKDFSYLDLYYSEKLGNVENIINDNIILVNIDRLSRKEIASVICKLEEQDPKVIGLDVIFKEQKDSIGDQLLFEYLKSDKIVATYVFDEKNLIRSHQQIIQNKTLSGYSNFNFKSESSVVRDFLGVNKESDTTFTSFGVKVAKKYLGDSWNGDLEKLVSNDIPINYSGNRDHFLVLEYLDIMEQGNIPLLKDKIIIVGYLGSPNNHQFDIEDKHFTPMNEKYVGKSPPDSFGIVIHANIVHMLIDQDFIKVVPTWLIALLTVVLTFMALCYFIWLNKRQLASYILRLNILQLLFIVFFVWISLLLFKNKILFKTASITAIIVFSIGLIGFYKKLAHYLYKRFKWKGYFFQD